MEDAVFNTFVGFSPFSQLPFLSFLFFILSFYFDTAPCASQDLGHRALAFFTGLIFFFLDRLGWVGLLFLFSASFLCRLMCLLFFFRLLLLPFVSERDTHFGRGNHSGITINWGNPDP
jgi:hypothetical protein